MRERELITTITQTLRDAAKANQHDVGAVRRNPRQGATFDVGIRVAANRTGYIARVTVELVRVEL